MADGLVSNEFMEELYSVNDECFFATCWQGHDELEQAVIDWARQDYKKAVEKSAEDPLILEELIRDSGDDILADFLNSLEKELRSEALTLMVENFRSDGDETFTPEIEANLEEILAAL